MTLRRQGAASKRVALVLLCALGGSVALAEGPQRLGPPPPGEVKRVVTLAPSLTQMVLALGRGELLVGVSRFDESAEVARLPRVGGFIDPSVEAVLALRPDLVLVQPAPGNRRPVEKLAELGVPVLSLPLHTVAQTLTALREVGRALGAAEQGAQLAEAVERSRQSVRARAKERTALRVLFVYEWEPLTVAGPGSFAAELITDAGAQNAARRSNTPYPVLGVEAAIAARPDVVVDAAYLPKGSERLRELPGLKDARWIRLPSRDLIQPGSNLGRGLEELFELLHPEPR